MLDELEYSRSFHYNNNDLCSFIAFVAQSTITQKPRIHLLSRDLFQSIGYGPELLWKEYKMIPLSICESQNVIAILPDSFFFVRWKNKILATGDYFSVIENYIQHFTWSLFLSRQVEHLSLLFMNSI